MPSIGSRQRRYAALIFGALFFLFGSIGVVGSWSAYRLDTGIQGNGERATGRVTIKSTLFAADGDSDYMVDYGFVLPSGTQIQAQRSVDKDLWLTLQEGREFVVLYSVDNPQRNFPMGGGVTSLGVTAFVSSVAALFVLLGTALLIGFVRGNGVGNTDNCGSV